MGSTKELKKRAVKPLWELRTRGRRTGRGIGWKLCLGEARRGLSCHGDKGQLLLISSDMLSQPLSPAQRGPWAVDSAPLPGCRPHHERSPLLRTAHSHSESVRVTLLECDTNRGRCQRLWGRHPGLNPSHHHPRDCHRGGAPGTGCWPACRAWPPSACSPPGSGPVPPRPRRPRRAGRPPVTEQHCGGRGRDNTGAKSAPGCSQRRGLEQEHHGGTVHPNGSVHSPAS